MTFRTPLELITIFPKYILKITSDTLFFIKNNFIILVHSYHSFPKVDRHIGKTYTIVVNKHFVQQCPLQLSEMFTKSIIFIL